MAKILISKGFTLIEVLVAMVVLAIGLLGMAGMQTNGLRHNISAYNKGQATQLGYDMVDRMRANMANAEMAAASTYATVNPDAAVEQTACKQIDNPCSAGQMAQHDLYLWNKAITEILPNGRGSITFVDPVFTITVTWDDNRDGSNTSDDPNFQLSFII